MQSQTLRVLDQYRTDSTYADEVGKRYHFRKNVTNKLYNLLNAPGMPFIYYEPEKHGKGEYYGCGILGGITPDPAEAEAYFVAISDYKEFPKPVSRLDSQGNLRESPLFYNKSNAVRQISLEDFTAICHEGGVQPLSLDRGTTSPFTLSPSQLKMLWARFHQRVDGFTDFADPGPVFSREETNYKRAILKKFEQELGREGLFALVTQGKGKKAIKDIARLLINPPANFVSFHGWADALGGEDNEAAACEILRQYLQATSAPYEGPYTTKSIFAACAQHNVKARWDVLGALLWALRPEDFFPVKISYYRKLSQELGFDLPTGLPDAEKLHILVNFFRGFRLALEPHKPSDWVDVQSFIWCVCPTTHKDEAVPLTDPPGALQETSPVPASRRYWTFSPGPQAEHWDEFYQIGIMAIGWDQTGDLSYFKSKDEIRNEYLRHWPTDSDPKNDIHALWQFSRDIRVGDVVFVNHGRTRLLGCGVVEGAYEFDNSRPNYKHVHRVKWLTKCEAQIPDGRSLHGKTLTEVSDDPSLVQLYATTAGLGIPFEELLPSAETSPQSLNPLYSLEQLTEETGVETALLERWTRAIERKGQAVFYGPPGTGKTFLAQKLAQHLIGGGDGVLELVQFHPAYAYEDFMQGLRPKRVPGGLDYPLEPGRFVEFCEKAHARQGVSVLIIDEINRANLARVFGELMYLLEYRQTASQGIPLAGGGRFRIPSNVRIIGTMNTADRSIALVDHALRRRFAFFPLGPNYDILRRFHTTAETGFAVENLIKQLTLLNAAINDPHYSLGISFFMRPNLAAEIQDIWTMEIEPYLEEYFFDQRDKFQQFRWDKVSPNIIP